MTSGFVTNTGHSYENIALEKAAEFAKHPEYWALVTVEENGQKIQKRQGPQFEWGNPGLRQLVIDWAVDYFKKYPDADMVSVDPADGGGVSESAESKAYGQGNAANAPFMLANEVARALRKAYPGHNKLVGMYAYAWHSDPPPFALEPNVYVQLTMAFQRRHAHASTSFSSSGPGRSKIWVFTITIRPGVWDEDKWPGGWVANKSYATEMIRRFQKTNALTDAYATSISAESSGATGASTGVATIWPTS